MNEPRFDVSIVIPSYNRLWCLPRAVDSCRGSRCRTQIIVVDDGSSDRTADWLRQQPDITAVVQPNQGQTWAVNHGGRLVEGTFVRFLDSDDYLAPGTIDRQFKEAVRTGADVVYGRVDLKDEDTGVIEVREDTPAWDDFMAVMLGEGYGSHFLGMQFRTDLVRDIPRRPEFALREDRMFLLEVALRGPKVAPVSGCVGYWTKHSRQMHTGYRGLTTTVAAWQMSRLYERILGELERRGELTPRRARASSVVLWRAAHEIARTHLEDAARIADSIKKRDPEFVPPENSLKRGLYARLGFRTTQRLLRLGRAFRGPSF